MPNHPRNPASRLERWFRLWPARSAQRNQPPSSGPVAKSAIQNGPSNAPKAAKDPVRPTVLVTVLGLSGRALDEVLELVANQVETTRIAPVFITDAFDFGPFRRRRLRFEYLPDRDRQQRFAPELDWDLYLRRRYAQLAEKWQAQSVISFGRQPPQGCVVDGRPARRYRGSTAPKVEQKAERNAAS